MELAAGAPMFTRFAYDQPAEMADLLDQAVELLHERAKRMRAEGAAPRPDRGRPAGRWSWWTSWRS